MKEFSGVEAPHTETLSGRAAPRFARIAILFQFDVSFSKGDILSSARNSLFESVSTDRFSQQTRTNMFPCRLHEQYAQSFASGDTPCQR